MRLAAATLLAIAGLAGCSTDHERSNAPSSSAVKQQNGSDTANLTAESSVTTIDSGADAATDLPGLLGAAARAATSSRRDASHLAGQIQVADVLIKPTTLWGLLVDAPSIPLSEDERAGIRAEYSPFPIFFEDLSTDGPMLLLSQPVIEGTTVVVAYQIRCGLDRDAVCAVGGAFRLQRIDGKWKTIATVSQWIS